MPDDFDHSSEPTFTSFIPLTILLSGFIIWFCFQDYELNAQRSALNKQFDASKQTLLEAQNIDQRYLALIKDLNTTAQNDDYAKAILNDALKGGLISDAVRAGLLQIQQNPTNSDSAPAAPTPDSSK